MTALYDIAKPIFNSSFGQLVIQSGRVSAGTALRLGGITLVGHLLMQTSDTATRLLNQAPYVGFVAEYANPALWINRAIRKLDAYCDKGAFWIAGKFKWHAITFKWHAITNEEQDLALKHIDNQRFKSSREVKNAKDSSNKQIKSIDLTATATTRILLISSLFKSVFAVGLAGLVANKLLAIGELINPGMETWNKVGAALNIPVVATL